AEGGLGRGGGCPAASGGRPGGGGGVGGGQGRGAGAGTGCPAAGAGWLAAGGRSAPCARSRVTLTAPKQPPTPPQTGTRHAASPEPSPAVAGRPLRVSKGGGRSRRRRPGDMERKGLPAAAGPLSSHRSKKQIRTRETGIKKPRRQGGPAGLVERDSGRSRRSGSLQGKGESGGRHCICRELDGHPADGRFV